MRCQNVEILQSKHPGQHCWADYSRVPQSEVLSQRYCQTLTSVEYHQHTGEYKSRIYRGSKKEFPFSSNVDKNEKNFFLYDFICLHIKFILQELLNAGTLQAKNIKCLITYYNFFKSIYQFLYLFWETL